ncbi:MAG: DUF2971 domain-containing protein [Nitrospirae bacterium]|nr:DUF2971 domain-containing protein [Nitrospirota bacterium]
MNVMTAINVLVNKTLRWSSPLLFNDPFDTARQLQFGFSDLDLHDRLIGELRRILNTSAAEKHQIKSRSLRDILDALHSLSNEGERNQKREQMICQIKGYLDQWKIGESVSFKNLQKIWESTLPHARVLSLSEINDSAAMWNHYSDKHGGVVIELECVDMYDSPLLLAKPVIYSDDTLVLGNVDLWVKLFTRQIEFNYTELFGPLDMTKRLEWQYEKEWRIISFEKNSDQLFSDYSIHPRTVHSIYLGHDITLEDKSTILRLADHELSHLSVYETHFNVYSRSIEFKRIK